MADDKTWRAPWSQGQVDALNYWQERRKFHPYTCARPLESHHNLSERAREALLVATADGWECEDPDCDYRQDWAHALPLVMRLAALKPSGGVAHADDGPYIYRNEDEVAVSIVLDGLKALGYEIIPAAELTALRDDRNDLARQVFRRTGERDAALDGIGGKGDDG